MTEAQIEEKIGRWLKLCPSKVGTDDIDDKEDGEDEEQKFEMETKNQHNKINSFTYNFLPYSFNVDNNNQIKFLFDGTKQRIQF